MKKILIAAVATAAVVFGAQAYAAQGFYVGGQAGYSQAYLDKTLSQYEGVGVNITRSSRSGLAGRVYGGYNLNKFLGVELGVAKYAEYKYNVSTGGSLKGNAYAADLLGVGTLPLGGNFNLFAKGGMAYVEEKEKAHGTTGVTFGNGKTSDTDHFWRPELVLGASYDLSDSLSLNLSYSRIFGKEDTSKYLPSLGLWGLGVQYDFG